MPIVQIFWEPQPPGTCQGIALTFLKGKVVPVQDMDTLGGSEGIAPLILNLGTKQEVSVHLHTPASLTAGEGASCTRGTRVGVGPRAGLDIME